MPELLELAWLAHAVHVRSFSALFGHSYLHLGELVMNKPLQWCLVSAWALERKLVTREAELWVFHCNRVWFVRLFSRAPQVMKLRAFWNELQSIGFRYYFSETPHPPAPALKREVGGSHLLMSICSLL